MNYRLYASKHVTNAYLAKKNNFSSIYYFVVQNSKNYENIFTNPLIVA